MVSGMKTPVYSRFAPFLFTLMLIASASAEDVWTDTSLSTGSQNPLSDITWGDGMFVAVGHRGAIMTSPDGMEWEQRTSGSDENLYSVCWGGGQFIAVGAKNTVLASLDGREWSPRNTWIQLPSGHDPDYYSVGYGNGLYVTSGDIIIHSQDGIDWTATEGNLDFQSVGYGNGIFVAASFDHALLSENGREWNPIYDIPSIQQQQMPGQPIISPVPPSLKSVAYGNGIFMIVGENPPIMISENGTDWEIADSTNPYNNDIAFNGDEFIIAGDNIYATSDGTDKQAVAEGFCERIACNDSVCVALLHNTSDVVVLKRHASAIVDRVIPHVNKAELIRADAGFLYISDVGPENQVAVHDMAGRVVPLQLRNARKGSVRIPVDHLAPGMYLVRVTTGERTFHSRMLIGARR